MNSLKPVPKFVLVLLTIFSVVFGIRSLLNSNTTTSDKKVNVVKTHWKMTTAWSKECLIMQEEMKSLAKDIEDRSSGAVTIEFVAPPKGKLTDLFDAVANNEIQIVHGTSYYWKEKIPASVFFSSIPFGMSHDEAEKWLNTEGVTLWQNLYQSYNVIPFPCGHSGAQMGGWFNKEINTIEDFDGLWMRIAGLGGSVLEKHGVRIKECGASEIYSFLNEDKLHRAAEFIGPYDDYNLGLHQIGTYYYDGWQEPNTIFELLVNQTAYNELSPDIQSVIKFTIEKYNERIYRKYTELNSQYRKKLKEKGVEFKTFSPAIKRQLNQTTKSVIEQYINEDASNNSRLIYESYKKIKTI
jgi:TRAP-type mannitol/chloroaromatic compound transport system substrate-binding protein